MSGAKSMRQGDRTPWLVAGAAIAGLLVVLLIMVIRNSPGSAPALASESPLAEPTASANSPPDISDMTPRERFNRLYNRIMTAAQAGEEATVTQFTPMALMAYAQLDTVDVDARYHVALLKVHTGDVTSPRALADSILREAPGHLFGYMIRGTVARFQKDQPALNSAYAGFLKRYDAEMKANRPEYAEHRAAIEGFRQAALDAN